MAIDKTGISSLETGAPDITYTGDEGPQDPRTMSDIDKIILEHWLQQGGSYGDTIPEEFKLEIIKMYGLDKMASAQDMAGGGIARLGYANGQRVGFRVGKGAGMEKTSDTGMAAKSAPDRSHDRGGQQHQAQAAAVQAQRQRALESMSVPRGQETISPETRVVTDSYGNVLPGYTGPEKTTPIKDVLDSVNKTRYDLAKFTQGPWTYDKRKRFINSLSDRDKRKLGYNFNVDWDDLDEEEKERLMSYDVYNDLLDYGYRDWLDKDYESKFGPRGGEGEGMINPGAYMGYPSYEAWLAAQAQGGIGGIDTTPETETETETAAATTTTSDPFQVASLSAADLDRIYGTSIPTTGTLGWTRPSPNILQHQFVADGGRIGYAYGGDVRQNYGLGKLVKKAFKSIGKVAKSPMGKMALMAGLGGLGGFGPAAGLKGSALGKFLIGTGLPTGPVDAGPSTGLLGKMLLNKGTGWSMANISPWKAIGGLSALGGLYTAMDPGDEEEPDWLRRWRADKAAADAYWGSRFEDAFADGGRIGYQGGGDLARRLSELIKKANAGTITPQEEHEMEQLEIMLDYGPGEAQGGRIGAQEGGLMQMADLDSVKDGYSRLIFGKPLEDLTEDEIIELEIILKDKLGGPFTQKEMPQPDRAMAQEGGLMDLGGMEKDYRNEGGFVPIGGQERADDVPARLSKNEFVFTADAVRNAGGGDIDKGAEIMENVMENLEKGGNISEESQGLEGARNMFATSQRLEGVL
jgi:hypothetical protein